MAFLKDIVEDASFFRSKFLDEMRPVSLKSLLLCYLFNPEFRLVFWFRLYSCLYQSGLRKVGLFIYQVVKRRYSSDIHPAASIGVPFKLGHHMNIVVGPKAKIGQRVYIFNGVTLGNKNVGGADAMPTVGDNVIIGTGSKILGPIMIGTGAVIGANSVVINDVATGEMWAGVPAKKIK